MITNKFIIFSYKFIKLKKYFLKFLGLTFAAEKTLFKIFEGGAEDSVPVETIAYLCHVRFFPVHNYFSIFFRFYSFVCYIFVSNFFYIYFYLVIKYSIFCLFMHFTVTVDYCLCLVFQFMISVKEIFF